MQSQVWRELISNDVLWIGVAASLLAQLVKPFTYWLSTHKLDWRRLLSTGGMPSSHSALICAIATSVGIDHGFDSAYFAIATAVAMIVTYDAANVRRQAGFHARVLNKLTVSADEQKPLKEDLGHTWGEVTVGIVFGMALAIIWKAFF
ncbi:MAG: divergent PAP2 family protein [Anaerolineae bacterium]|nr:divergent PAP2 family protein [Anaerolineae bacterium]